MHDLTRTAAVPNSLHRAFPDGVTEWSDPVTRRQFLTLMGASLALAGGAGCSPAPPEPIAPSVHPPEKTEPGRPLNGATAALDALQRGAFMYFLKETNPATGLIDRKSTRLNSSHANISYAVFC